MKLAIYGKREWLGGGLLALAIGSVGAGLMHLGFSLLGGTICVVVMLLWLALAAFFRVPDRRIPQDPSLLLAPADGVVKDIETILDHGIEPFEGKPLVRIGIFLSVLDVHVNRAPCELEVIYRKYKEGFFHDARDPRCARENESLLIAGWGRVAGEKVAVAIRQVSGAIARRIVCEAEPDSFWERGQIYGMIKFGSRTELFFPADPSISVCVELGEKVRSGITPLAQKTERGISAE
jgi:phosphatidylserine decarboxylase